MNKITANFDTMREISRKYKLSAYERETIINLQDSEEEATAQVFDRRLWKQLEKAAEVEPDRFYITDYNGYPEWHFPKTAISIRKPSKFTEDQKQKRSERMKILRDKRSNKNE